MSLVYVIIEKKKKRKKNEEFLLKENDEPIFLFNIFTKMFQKLNSKPFRGLDFLKYSTVALRETEVLKFSKKLRIWSHLLKKSLMENFIFCAVMAQKNYNPNRGLSRTPEDI